jgi:hypothetical protein
MNAKEIYLDADNSTVKVLKDVEVITSSGTIYSDNALFNREQNSIFVVKEIKRPITYMNYQDKKGEFEADSMLFERDSDKNRIRMNGRVKGKIHIEEEEENNMEISETNDSVEIQNKEVLQ